MPPDPVVPPIQPLPPEVADSHRTAQAAIEALTGTVGKLIGGIDTLVSKFTGATSTANVMAGASTNAGAGFDLMATGIFGATEAFAVFSDQGKNIAGFEAQLHSLGSATSIVTDRLKGLAISAGAPAYIIGGTSKMLEDFAINVAKSADAALKLQNGYLGMMGATGGLGAVFNEAGDSLQDLNAVMFKQNELISSIAGSTRTSMGEVSGYYKELGTAIPNSVNQQIEATDRSGKSYSTLQGAMTLATGTGRAVASVVTDMKTAWENYGLSGDKALEFTARASELNNKFGINLEYTEGFIKKNAEAFHLISQGGDNASASLNRLFESFKNTGLSAKDSTEMIGHMTGQMSKLTMGQKAFLSAQSGGPGGLRGALQIENQLRSGDVEGVLKKAENALKKQFGGKIYTQEEGAQSEFAAAQFTRQRAMLRSGAFGGLAKDDDSATRILEAFKKGTSGVDALKDPAAGLNDALSKGEMLQETANTELTKLRLLGERQLAIASNTALNLVQNHLGSKDMVGRTPAGDARALRLRQFGKDESERASFVGAAIKGQTKLDVNESRKSNGIEILQSLHAAAPGALKVVLEKMITGMSGVTKDTGKDKNIADMNNFKKQLEDQQANASKIALAGGKSMQDNEEIALAGGKSMQDNEEDGRLLALINKGLSIYGASDVNKGAATGQAVNASLASASGPTAAQQTRNQAGHAPGQHPAQAQKQKMEVTFKAVCFKCNKPYEADATTKHVSGGTL